MQQTSAIRQRMKPTSKLTREEIEASLTNGDRKTLAEITTFSYSHVVKVIEGKRTNDKILRIARRIIEHRERLKREEAGVRRAVVTADC